MNSHEHLVQLLAKLALLLLCTAMTILAILFTFLTLHALSLGHWLEAAARAFLAVFFSWLAQRGALLVIEGEGRHAA